MNEIIEDALFQIRDYSGLIQKECLEDKPSIEDIEIWAYDIEGWLMQLENELEEEF